MAGSHRFTDIRWTDVTGSTNADVLVAGRNGDPEGVVIVADTQTAGRGRHGRDWVAPPGSGLLFSLLLRPPARITDLLTATAALAVQDVAAALGATGVGLKWPNDLIVTIPDATVVGPSPEPTRVGPDPKLAGILAEAEWAPGAAAASGHRAPTVGERALVALGIGLNVASSADFPPEIANRRVALDDLIGRPVDRRELLDDLLAGFDGWYRRLVVDHGEVLDAWRSRCVTLGRRVRVDLGATDLVGTANDLDARGRLVVRDDNGSDHVVAAGDVVHLRPSAHG